MTASTLYVRESRGGLVSDVLFFCPAAFFQDCISEQDLDEMNIEIIRNTLYKVEYAVVCVEKLELRFPSTAAVLPGGKNLMGSCRMLMNFREDVESGEELPGKMLEIPALRH